jgi:RNA polymerase sigma-70 factor (ECF subfamily)
MSRDLDAQLAQRCAEKDPHALRSLYDRHAPRLLVFLERMLGDASRAEDICQEAFLRLWRKADMFDPRRGSFSSWLYRAAANLAFNRLSLRSSKETTLEGAEELLDSSPDQPWEKIQQEERREMLRAAIQRLSPADRAILELRHLEERSVAEVAEILDIPEGTVKSRVHYALRRLKSFLQPGLRPETQGASE